MKKWIIYVIIYSFVPMLWSQTDSLTLISDSIHLKGVIIKSAYSKVKKDYNIIESKNIATAFVNRGFFFKQYGGGGLSTIAYRGTDASHTSVYWNGVAINSNLNGQTDFSMLRNTNVAYVSLHNTNDNLLDNAIGGVVLMNEIVSFRPKKELTTAISYGSFNTFDALLKGKYATDHFYSSFSYSRIKATNDYAYYNTTLKNDNAAYTTTNLAGTLAYKWTNANTVKLQVLHLFTDRNTARTLSSTNNARLALGNTVALLNWHYNKDAFTHNMQFSLKKETSDYQFDKDLALYSKHQALVKTLSYKPVFIFKNNDKIAFVLSNENTSASGDNLLDASVNLVKVKAKYTKQLTNKNSITAEIQQDFTAQYTVPFLFQLKSNFRFANAFELSTTFGTNYRLPTFNDLFWNPGGNPNLKPEHSFNTDFTLNYKKNDLGLMLNPFYIHTKDLIKWQPSIGGIWSPINIKETTNLGLDFNANYHLYKWKFQFNYKYTKAVDLALKKQLTYVPLHQSYAKVTYAINNKIDLKLNTIYTGNVFITTSNTQQLKGYLVNNTSLNYSFTKDIQLHLMVNNIFNTNYMAYADRPMPLRNFKIQFIYNTNFKQLNKNKNENNY